MTEGYRYYASCLSGAEGQAYFRMAEAFSALDRSVRVPRMPTARLTEIYTMVKYDCPDLFFLSEPSYRVTPGAAYTELIPDYVFPVRQIPSLREAADKRMARLLAGADRLTETEKVRFVRDFLTEKVVYEKLTRHYSHEIYGVLFHGIGVCEGIAKTAKALLDRLSVASLVVLGDSGEEGTRHAWNIIYLDRTPLHYDFTFDLSTGRSGRAPRYFGLTDDSIYRDHRQPVFPVPECRGQKERLCGIMP